MYQKNPLLYEFSPADLVTSVRGLVPHLKSSVNSVKGGISKFKSLKKTGRKPTYALGDVVANHYKYDPTLVNPALKSGEAARSVGSGMVINALPPMPSWDADAIKNAINAIRSALKNNPLSKPSTKTVKNLRSAISEPTKNLKRFVVDRATTDTILHMPLFYLPGGITITNPMAPVGDGLGLGFRDINRMIKSGANYYKGAYNNAKENARKKLLKLKNRPGNSNYQPAYA